MQQYFDMIAVLPVGPNNNLDFVTDTIESIYFYCQCNLKILLIDDSQQGAGAVLKARFPDVDLMVKKKSGGMAGGLYITLSLAFKYAVENYRFKTLLKIDTDALVTGYNPQADAEAMFSNNPHIGIAGLCKSGNEIIDFNNNVFDNRWPRNYMFDITCTWKVIKRPVANPALKKHFRMAFANGYEIGENVFGGAYFVSEALLVALNDAKLLPIYGLKNTRMEEDHLWSMFAKIVNLDMGDLASGDLPFGVAWKKLPASPETLLTRKKKIIHSTRGWENMNEHDIRNYFKQVRVSANSVVQ